MDTGTQAQIERIKQQLTQTINQKIGNISQRKKWQQLTPISQSELTEIEHAFNVCLPEAYRQFLLQVTNGGFGPTAGLIPLADATKYFREHNGYETILSTPFTHTEEYHQEDEPDVCRAEELNASKQMDNDEFYRTLDFFHAGTLDVCDLGDGYTIKLVVTGPTRGMVWNDFSAVDAGMIPLNMHFLDWYEQWLDQQLENSH